MTLSMPRFCAVLAGVIALSWFLPDIFTRATRTEVFHISGQFSPVSEEFIVWESGADSLRYRSEDGRYFSAREGRSLMPFVFAYDAAKWGLFPIDVRGERINFEQAKSMTQMVRLRPRLWTGEIVPLYPLFESQPEKAELELPPDVFRVTTNGIVFINAVNGSINHEKSKLFSASLSNAGITFPITAIGGNPSALKSFDEGYFLTDAGGYLFQLKMVHGRPEVRNTGIMVLGKVRYIHIDEHVSRITYGYIVTDDGVFSIGRDDVLRQFPFENFSADTNTISITQMPVFYSGTQQQLNQTTVTPLAMTATDSNFSPVRRFDAFIPEAVQAKRDRMNMVASMLFPITIKQFTPLWNGPLFLITPEKDLTTHLIYALLGGAICCLIFFVIRRKMSKNVSLLELLIVLCSGVPGLVSVLIFGPVNRN